MFLKSQWVHETLQYDRLRDSLNCHNSFSLYFLHQIQVFSIIHSIILFYFFKEYMIPYLNKDLSK